MILKARRTKGDSFTKNDELQATITEIDFSTVSAILHSIELISGVGVTHGGGAQSGEFLHYKSVERDANSDGVVDYSNTIMQVVQDKVDVSIVKVIAKYLTEAAIEKYTVDKDDYDVAYYATTDSSTLTDYSPPSLEDYYVTVKTGEINLEWTEDIFV